MACPLPYYCRLAVFLLGAGVLTGARPTPAQAAQRPSALIAGRVIDQSSHIPIARARVVLLGTPHDTASDSAGHFAHDGLSAGTYLLQIRAIGYAMSTWVIRLKSDDAVDRDFEMTGSELRGGGGSWSAGCRTSSAAARRAVASS